MLIFTIWYTIFIIILTTVIDNGILTLWLISIYIFLIIISGMPDIKLQLESWNYPPSKIKSAGKYSFLFDWKRKKSKDVQMPIELIKAAQFLFWHVIIFTFIFWIIGILIPYSEVDIFILYLFTALPIALWFIGKSERTAFVTKYKRTTRYNWIYQFWRPLKRTEPEPVKIGDGAVEVIDKQKRKTYVSIRMQDTQELVTQVLYCREVNCQTNQIYPVYEICSVKYII